MVSHPLAPRGRCGSAIETRVFALVSFPRETCDSGSRGSQYNKISRETRAGRAAIIIYDGLSGNVTPYLFPMHMSSPRTSRSSGRCRAVSVGY